MSESKQAKAIREQVRAEQAKKDEQQPKPAPAAPAAPAPQPEAKPEKEPPMRIRRIWP